MDRCDTSVLSRFFRFVPVLWAVLAIAAVPGCGTSLWASLSGNDVDGASADDLVDLGGSLIVPAPQSVLSVKFVNLTPLAVETKFYVSTDALENAELDLFTPDLLYTAGIGVASRGILAPEDSDAIDLPCGDNLIVGTQGSVLRDPDLGTELGTGPTRFFQSGVQFGCGAEIMFEYIVQNNAYIVQVSLN